MLLRRLVGQLVPAAAFVLLSLVLRSGGGRLRVPLLALGVHFVGTLLLETLVLAPYVRGHAGTETTPQPFRDDALRIFRTAAGARLFALAGGILGGATALALTVVTGKVSEVLVGVGIGVGVVVTEAATLYATRLTVLEGLRPRAALRQSLRIMGRHPLATAGAYVVPSALAILALAGTRYLALAALAIGVRWLRDVWVTRLALAPSSLPSPSSRSMAGLAVVLLFALTALRGDDACAQVTLLVAHNAATDTGGTKEVAAPTAAALSTSEGGVTGSQSDTITPVIVARANVDAAMARKQKALIAMREAAIKGGDTSAAEAEVTASEQALRDAKASVRTALEANEAATQLAVKNEQLRIYGSDGPSTLQSVGSGTAAATGLTVGMGQGTVVGAWDSVMGLGHAVLHPIQTGKAIVSLFTQPPLTKEQEVASDVADLQRERAERLAMVDAPFETSRQDGYLLGHDVIGPMVAGEGLGAVGSVAGRVAGGLLKGTAETVARAPYEIEVTGLAQMDGPRPTLKYSSDTPVFRVQDPSQPLLPHPSEYFQNMDYGLPSIITKADGTRVFQSYDALFVSTDMKEITLLRQQQGYFEQGATLHTSTLGELLEAAGPGARVFIDQRLPDHSLIIAAPPK